MPLAVEILAGTVVIGLILGEAFLREYLRERARFSIYISATVVSLALLMAAPN